jgi:hypothetical protein
MRGSIAGKCGRFGLTGNLRHVCWFSVTFSGSGGIQADGESRGSWAEGAPVGQGGFDEIGS